jgi:diguanylate cyclase (GGDEF)-like protein
MSDEGATSQRRATMLVGAWVLLAGLLVFQLTRQPVSDDAGTRLLEELVYLLPFCLAVGSSAVAARRSPKGDDRRFWVLLSATLVFVLLLEIAYVVEVSRGTPSVMITGVWAFVFAAVPALIFAYLLASLSRATEASWASRLQYAASGLIASIIVYLLTYGILVAPFLDRIGLTDHAAQAQAAFRTAIGITVLIGTFLNVGALKATAWRRWEMLTVGGIALYALGLCLEPVLIASELGWTSYAEQIAEALWMAGQYLIFLGAVLYLADRVHGVPVRRHVPTLVLAGGWSAIAFDAAALISTMTLLAVSLLTESVFEQRLYLVGSIVLAALFICREVFGAIASGRLLNASVIDHVTRLYNARQFPESLESEIDIAIRTGEPLSVVLLDLDGLELMDTVEGLGSSDRVITAAATAIRGMADRGLFAARLGWDVFGLLMAETPGSVAAAWADRIRAAVHAATGVTASAGVATFPTDAIERTELLRLAEGALYHAKEHGKDRTVVYDELIVRHMNADERIASLERRNQLAAVRALAAAVDGRERGTEHHSQRVAELCVMVGRALGLAEEELQALDLAALLHDVGYIGVPERILSKPGPLTAAEWAHVREHTVLGERILESAGLGPALPWIRSHHERWDGSGYPDGLASEGIPLQARILAVCDSFDAMTHDRSFRQAMTKQAALQEIDLNMGIQFDPRVAEAFIRVISAADEAAYAAQLLRVRPQEAGF